MKIITFAFTSIVVTTLPIRAYAIYCNATNDRSHGEVNAVSSCWDDGESDVLYYNGYGVRSCTTCDAGYLEYDEIVDVPGCDNTITYTTCDCRCTNCEYDSFSIIDEGYESRQRRTCDCSSGTPVCKNEGYDYRCSTGFYGVPTNNGTAGCERCPGSYVGGLGSGMLARYSDAGSTDITACYMPKDMEFCNTSGCFTLKADCYWKK